MVDLRLNATWFSFRNDVTIAKDAAKVLKTQFFLYEADTARLEVAFKSGNEIAKEILESYAKAEFYKLQSRRD
jgi:aconitate hydratase 2/2-methylisocitrate dehydratase